MITTSDGVIYKNPKSYRKYKKKLKLAQRKLSKTKGTKNREKLRLKVAKILKFKTNEKGRKAGYKQIKNLKKMLYLKAKFLMGENDLFSN